MLKVLKYVGIGLIVLILLLLAAVFVLPKTGPGQALVDRIARPIVENVVEAQLGSDIEFDRLRGALPGELIISNVELKQNEEIWLSADELALNWSPLALLRREIIVQSLESSDIVLYRMPELPDRAPRPDESNDRDGLPSLPRIVLDEIQMDTLSIREPVFGQRYDLTFKGAARAQGRTIEISTEIDTTSESDSLRVAVDLDQRDLTLAISALSAPDGLLTTAIGAEDTVWLSLEGEGPLEEWQGMIEAQAGNYGSVAGQVGGDLVSVDDLIFALTIVPGPLLPDSIDTVVGDALFIQGQTGRNDEHIVLTLEEARARFGEVAGTVGIPVADNAMLTADVTGQLSEALATDYNAAQLAGPLSLTASLDRVTDPMRFDGRLETGLATLGIINGQITDEIPFQGNVVLTANSIPFENERLDPILQGGTEIRARLTVTEDNDISAEELSARLGQNGHRIQLAGVANYKLSNKTLSAGVAGSAGADAMAALLGQDLFDAPTEIRLNADGTLQDAVLRFSAKLPGGSLEDYAFTAGQLTTNLSGLPRRPTGSIRLVADDMSYDGMVELASTAEAIRLSRLTFTGGNLTINGTGRYVPDTGAGQIALVLDSPTPTTLVTGQTIAGGLTLDANYTADTGAVEAVGELTSFRFDRIDITTAQFAARGSLEALNVDLTATNAALPGVYLAAASVDATANLTGETQRIDLSRFRIAIDEDTDEQRITLLAPTTITLGERISLAPTRLDWLKNGAVEATGSFAPSRWTADLSLKDVSVPRFTIPLTGTLTLDTNNSVPALFSVTAKAAPEDVDETYLLAAEGRWTGQAADIDATLSSGSDPLITAVASWPVILTRQNGRISVELPDSAISGNIIAQGDIDPLYAFLPQVPPYLSGSLDGQMDLTGSAKSPGLDGKLTLTNGRFEESSLGATLTNLNGDLSFTYGNGSANGTIALTGSGADGREGAVDLNGTVTLEGETSRVDTRLVLNDATIIDGPTLKVRTGADITLSGAFDDMAIAGTVDIGQIDAGIPEASGGNGDASIPDYPDVNVIRVDGEEPELPELATTQTVRPEIALDLKVTARNEIFVRGRGIDTEWGADLDIEGTAAAPLINGDVTMRRGSLDFAGRDFTFDRGVIAFRRNEDALARLNARAVYEAEDVTAYVNVTGPVDDPSISLSSTPSLPDENVMAIILFGKQPTELSALESLQIANALRSIAGIGPSFGGGTGLQDTLGLDALSFGLDDETGEGVVAVGKYISDDIYVSARQSARGTSSEVTVTYEVSDKVTLESTLQPNGAQDVSVNYKKDY